MSIVAQSQGVLNFVVTGEIRSGASVVQSSIDGRADCVCHADLFHPDDAVRREAHEGYFGPSKDPERMPEWFKDGETVPFQYINHAVLDNPMQGECAVGFKVLYPAVRRWELFELFEERCREGDFCLVHVARNPVACFVSLKQAEQSGVWARGWNSLRQTSCPSAVTVDAGELIAFCRNHASLYGKIRAACKDSLEISYRDVLLDYQDTMRKVFKFLELPESDEPAVPGCRRLKNRDILARIANLNRLRSEVPSDIRALLDDEELL